MRPYLFAAASILALSGCATMPPPPPGSAALPAPTATAGEQLHALFKASDEATLKRQPIAALARGDLRYADQLGPWFKLEATRAERQAAQDELATLARIDRAALSPTDRIAYDVFQWDRQRAVRSNSDELSALTDVRPIDHFFGVHTFYPDLASGQGMAPFKTLADYENNIKRHRQFAEALDRAIVRFREGMASGVVHPKLVVRNMIDQLDTQLKAGADASPYLGPLKKFPSDISAADQSRLSAETTAVVRDEIFNAYTRLRNFLRDEYLPVARDSVGLVGMKGGDTLYRWLIEENTTLPLTAEEVHQTGLSEVARITREMDAIRQQVGFKGDLNAFRQFLRSDARFQPKTRDEMRVRFEEIGKRVDARVREQFSTIPKAPLVIRAVPEYREKTDAGGSYNQGTPDGTRPGVFYYNAYDLPSRSIWGYETLYLHEAVPGHHFQISLAQENAALPNFMRFGGNTAYVEGWALYAETLWRELGVETDPYQRYGGLDDEMLRAMRLVVDTGIHAKGWSRDQAIKYMLDNSAMGRTDAVAEVERYIAIPGQALAYKTGALTIQRLKAKAQAALGTRFDPREFHAEVLMTGALPLAVLERKIDDWIASKR